MPRNLVVACTSVCNHVHTSSPAPQPPHLQDCILADGLFPSKFLLFLLSLLLSLHVLANSLGLATMPPKCHGSVYSRA